MTSPEEPDRRISVGNTQMTRPQTLDALEANIGFAKDAAADLLRYVGRLPASPEQAHILKELQRIQGQLGGNLLQLARALLADAQNEQRRGEPPAR